jgi:hypothetical protein
MQGGWSSIWNHPDMGVCYEVAMDSSKPAMPYPSTPCGQGTPGHTFMGWLSRRVGSLWPSSARLLPLWTPHYASAPRCFLLLTVDTCDVIDSVFILTESVARYNSWNLPLLKNWHQTEEQFDVTRWVPSDTHLLKVEC